MERETENYTMQPSAYMSPKALRNATKHRMNHQQQPETESIVSNLFAIKLKNVTQKLLPVN